jgi:hypothetical protein
MNVIICGITKGKTIQKNTICIYIEFENCSNLIYFGARKDLHNKIYIMGFA